MLLVVHLKQYIDAHPKVLQSRLLYVLRCTWVLQFALALILVLQIVYFHLETIQICKVPLSECNFTRSTELVH